MAKNTNRKGLKMKTDYLIVENKVRKDLPTNKCPFCGGQDGETEMISELSAFADGDYRLNIQCSCKNCGGDWVCVVNCPDGDATDQEY